MNYIDDEEKILSIMGKKIERQNAKDNTASITYIYVSDNISYVIEISFLQEYRNKIIKEFTEICKSFKLVEDVEKLVNLSS